MATHKVELIANEGIFRGLAKQNMLFHQCLCELIDNGIAATSPNKKFEIDIEDEAILNALNLYDNFDDKNNPCPVVKVKDDLFVHEQYHGPTRAFKDMALQPFGSILSHLAQKKDEKKTSLKITDDLYDTAR